MMANPNGDYWQVCYALRAWAHIAGFFKAQDARNERMLGEWFKGRRL
jgi:hypothetical protein